MSRIRRATCLALAALVGAVGCGRGERRADTGLKVVVIGLDGATFRVLLPLMEAGRAENLAAFAAKAAGGVLISPIDEGYTSPALWTMAVTGVTPDRHGILDFVLPLPGHEQDPDTEQKVKVPAASGHRTAPALWNMLDAHGLTSGVVGLWATWPAEKVRGAIVSERESISRMSLSSVFKTNGQVVPFLFSDSQARGVHPAAFRPEVDGLVLRPEAIEPATLRRFADFSDAEVEAIRSGQFGGNFNMDTKPLQELKVTVQSDRSFLAIGERVLQQFQPDLALIYLEGVDVIEHKFWGARAGLPQTPEPDRTRFKDVVDRYYAFTDELIAPLLRLADERTVVIVMSDHGFDTQPAHESGAWHDRQGIFLIAGGPVRAGAKFAREAGLLDVTPTLLALLGLPIGSDMPGRVVDELLDPEFLRAHPPRRGASYGRRAVVKSDIAETDVDEIWQERLEGLGYLGPSEGK